MPNLDDQIRQSLITAAQQVRLKAYAPFSNYLVGAALLGEDGNIYTGCNVENSAYPSTICAERVAVTKAVSEGVQKFSAIAVVTHDGGSPCGTCRQVMFEFAPTLVVIMANEHGQVIHENVLTELLPLGFRLAE